VDEQEAIWEKPRGEPRGVFLLLNGCNHGADGWWDAQAGCDDCLGLPEEKAIVKAAIDRGHVAVALSVVQQRTKMRCWANLTPPNLNTDMKSTLKTVKLLVEREGWQGLPLYAWGGSSGGTFAARLPYYLPMKGIMVQLKSVKGEDLEADPKDPVTGAAWPHPKVVYVYNRRDPVAQERAIDYTDALKAKDVPYALLGADPTPLSPGFFAQRVEEINATVSAQLYEALKAGGVLDEHGYLPLDPRKSDKRWQGVLRERVPYANTVRLEKFVSPIFEELNWAYSNHQGISDCTAAAFEFFETGKQPDEKMLDNPEFWALQGGRRQEGSPS
jgi:zinc transporter 2